MRAFITVVALVVLAGIAWFYFSADEAEPMVEDAAGMASEAASDAGAAAEQAGDDAAEAVDTATDQAADAADDTADTADEVLDNTLGTASDAGDAATDAANDTADAADDSLADALTVDGFDADRLRTAVENSSLGAGEKQVATTLIDNAEENPALIQSVIEQLQAEFGL
ncbi:MAG: hypothetical protein HKO04_08225 [Silicimonas sp.]|nr:hypothetical protein [Silicimonas sp.]